MRLVSPCAAAAASASSRKPVAGQQHRVHDRVVRQPGMALQRQASGEQPALVSAASCTARSRAWGARMRIGQASLRPWRPPLTAASSVSLEGVGGELYVPLGLCAKERGPVDLYAVDVGLRQEAHKGLQLRSTGAQAAGKQSLICQLIAHALMRHRAQGSVGSQLQEASDTGVCQEAHALWRSAPYDAHGQPSSQGMRPHRMRASRLSGWRRSAALALSSGGPLL